MDLAHIYTFLINLSFILSSETEKKVFYSDNVKSWAATPSKAEGLFVIPSHSIILLGHTMANYTFDIVLL